jgi:hypothetical protein
MERSLQDAARLQNEGQEDWWKAPESCLTHMGSLAEELEETYFSSEGGEQSSEFNLEAVFQKLVVPYLPRSGG